MYGRRTVGGMFTVVGQLEAVFRRKDVTFVTSSFLPPFPDVTDIRVTFACPGLTPSPPLKTCDCDGAVCLNWLGNFINSGFGAFHFENSIQNLGAGWGKKPEVTNNLR